MSLNDLKKSHAVGIMVSPDFDGEAVVYVSYAAQAQSDPAARYTLVNLTGAVFPIYYKGVVAGPIMTMYLYSDSARTVLVATSQGLSTLGSDFSVVFSEYAGSGVSGTAFMANLSGANGYFVGSPTAIAINAGIIRKPLEVPAEFGQGMNGHITASVPNDPLLGVESVDTGGDYILLPTRIGDTATAHQVVEILTQDEAMWFLRLT